MVALRQIDLVLEQGFSTAERKAVTSGSRSMLNFVERRLASSAFNSEFTKLNICCSKLPVAEALIRFKEPKTLAEIKVQFDPGDFTSSAMGFQRTCAEIIQRGVRAASAYTKIPVEEVTGAVAEFLAGGCVNGWVHADKLWIRVGVRCIVRCDLRTDQFRLSQLIYRGETIESEALLATTKPREFLFYPLLGKLSLKDNQITLRSKSNVISIFDLRTKTFVVAPVTEKEPSHSITE